MASFGHKSVNKGGRKKKKKVRRVSSECVMVKMSIKKVLSIPTLEDRPEEEGGVSSQVRLTDFCFCLAAVSRDREREREKI